MKCIRLILYLFFYSTIFCPTVFAGLFCNSEILTADGNFVDIQDIRARKHNLWSFNTYDSVVVPQVNQIYPEPNHILLLFIFFNKPDENTHFLALTPDQIVCSADGKWIRAYQIKPETKLFGVKGDVTITGVMLRPVQPGECLQTAYFLELEDIDEKTPHSFFVKGQNCPDNKAIMIHNGIPFGKRFEPRRHKLSLFPLHKNVQEKQPLEAS